MEFHMRTVTLLLITSLITVSLSSCAPRKLVPQAGYIKITPSTPSIVQNCKFLGDISDSNVHGSLWLESTPQERELDDTNFLKNEGKKLGANVVTLNKHQQVITKNKPVSPRLRIYRDSIKYDLEAKAYFCSPVSFKNINDSKPFKNQHNLPKDN